MSISIANIKLTKQIFQFLFRITNLEVLKLLKCIFKLDRGLAFSLIIIKIINEQNNRLIVIEIDSKIIKKSFFV